MAGRGSAPGERRGGRAKGVPNKINGDLRAMIIGALNDVGGQKYLADQALKNPGPFMALVGKIMPHVVQGDPNRPLEVKMSVEEHRRRALRMLKDAFEQTERERLEEERLTIEHQPDGVKPLLND